MMRGRVQPIFVWAAALACLAAAQAPAARFEVASIKPGDPNSHSSSSNTDRRFVTIQNWTLKRLIERAFGVQPYQVTGGPNWLDTFPFNINAKVDESEPELRGKEGQARLELMVQALLAERFAFQFHRETKLLPVYNLVVAKSGFKLEPVKATGGQSMNTNNTRLTAQGVDMATFAVYLSRRLERPVLDATGISGVFDFKLEWSPDQTSAKAADANETAGPSIFTALQEQLGLKLESAKGPVEIIVVDHAEKPTEN